MENVITSITALITGISGAGTLLLHERLQLITGDSPTFFQVC